MPLPPPRGRTRRALALTLLLICVALLSACLRYTESLTIRKDDTVSGIIVIAVRKPGVDDSVAAPSAPVGQALPRPVSGSASIQVTAFEHEFERGYKVTFRNATFDEVARFAPLADKGGALQISRSGGELSIAMTIDLTYAAKAEDIEYVKQHAKATVSLTVPGEVLSTDGAVRDRTITWTLTPLELNTLEATVRSTQGAATATASRSIDPVRAAWLAGILLALLGAGWLVLRPRLSGRERPAAAGPDPSRAPAVARLAASAGAQPAPTGPRRAEPRTPGTATRSEIPDPFGEPIAPTPPSLGRQRGGWPPPRPQWLDRD